MEIKEMYRIKWPNGKVSNWTDKLSEARKALLHLQLCKGQNGLEIETKPLTENDE